MDYSRINTGIQHLLAILICLLFSAGCASVVYSTNKLNYEIDSNVIMENYDPYTTHIGMAYSGIISQNPDLSGALLISNGSHALYHRLALVRMAKHSIELQTYIYENDITSRLLMYELKAAADRGVKIRIIVDDNGLDSDHSDIMNLDYHSNIEVKVFNPRKYRAPILKYPQMLFDLKRLNNRMHSKMFVVDNVAVIIGGRNIGSNYFDSDPSINFSDTEVLFLGKVAAESRQNFDEFWNFHKSIPAMMFPEQNKPENLEKLDNDILSYYESYPETKSQHEKIINDLILAHIGQDHPIYWGKAILVADSPRKTDGEIPVSPILVMLDHLWRMTTDSITISAAYFIPGEEGNERFISAVKSGADIDILTNSLSSTDVKIVYSAWRKYRDELLENGIDIYEYKLEGEKAESNLISSSASLHSKLIIFDDQITWVGSFNMANRSANIDTEIVVVFFNENFAAVVKEHIKEEMSMANSWQLSLDDNTTVWTTERDGETVQKRQSPDVPWPVRLLYTILSSVVPETLL